MFRIGSLGLTLAAGAILFAAPAPAAEPAKKTLGTIERIDPAFDKLVPKDAVIEMLEENKFAWAEGPIWLKDEKALALFRYSAQQSLALERGRRTQGILAPERLHGQGTIHRQGTGQQRPDHQQRWQAPALPARRPPRRLDGPEKAGRVHHARRQISRQTAQQPERPRRQIERRHLFHRSALRTAQAG